ncbi:MarR family winged helix-turn-helix transcriptional regulator [Mycobacterium sp. ITM-2016-00316]|uniref:MarR family winged helix-turn-helix transcriptional regulator n=1 Tax=Mycobacterium sp. ITM-2016-00316 TaxID=2099695 RepID=UPI000CF8512F|nr:MarR family winged helix-turn-helix transcriptional regulator [Mycobacterium sp. ITM-2016-00316]WNG81964.1 MarR family winged helix-turn-helix transcriptional regulator [Mycobacterium sp. ITM-2016-00316]
MPTTPFDHLDDLLTRIHVARQRPSWRRRLLDGADPVTNVSTLRTLRAVEHHQRHGGGASIGDVAEYLAVEHSTASRTVSAVVAAGLLTKSPADDDQRRSVLVLTDIGVKALATVTDRRRDLVAETVADWDTADIDRLLTLLERLTERIEAAASR